MIILGIETSCDETAAAVVKDGHVLLSNVVATSLAQHIQYGGVVPEIAARSHIESIIPVIEQALTDADCGWDDIDAIAVTYGPGLIGSLLIGVMTARTLAIAKNKPLYAINHVEAHVYAPFITDTKLENFELPRTQPEFPALALIVSGGHTQLAVFKGHGDYRIIGETHDDAIGEAFDKVAKIVGLPYPGGPSVERCAKDGDKDAIKLPLARLENSYDFSYSGLKTAVLRSAQKLVGKDFTLPSHELPDLLNDQQKADLSASFQDKAFEMLVEPLLQATHEYNPKSLIVGGGVSASSTLREKLKNVIPAPIFTDLKLCTDNAGMIAACAFYNQKAYLADPSSLSPNPSLTL